MNLKNRVMAEINIRAEINALDVGHVATFPLEKYEYVLSCRTRLQTTTGKKFTSRKNTKRGVIIIKRVKTN